MTFYGVTIDCEIDAESIADAEFRAFSLIKSDSLIDFKIKTKVLGD